MDRVAEEHGAWKSVEVAAFGVVAMIPAEEFFENEKQENTQHNEDEYAFPVTRRFEGLGQEVEESRS